MTHQILCPFPPEYCQHFFETYQRNLHMYHNSTTYNLAVRFNPLILAKKPRSHGQMPLLIESVKVEVFFSQILPERHLILPIPLNRSHERSGSKFKHLHVVHNSKTADVKDRRNRLKAMSFRYFLGGHHGHQCHNRSGGLTIEFSPKDLVCSMQGVLSFTPSS